MPKNTKFKIGDMVRIKPYSISGLDPKDSWYTDLAIVAVIDESSLPYGITFQKEMRLDYFYWFNDDGLEFADEV